MCHRWPDVDWAIYVVDCFPMVLAPKENQTQNNQLNSLQSNSILYYLTPVLAQWNLLPVHVETGWVLDLGRIYQT